MEGFVNYVTNNWTEIGVIALGTVIVCERIAAMTENKTDDKIFAFIHKALKTLGLKFPEAK